MDDTAKSGLTLAVHRALLTSLIARIWPTEDIKVAAARAARAVNVAAAYAAYAVDAAAYAADAAYAAAY
ncbi:MAG TPA: hypothetical protein PKZ97_17695, partial [Azospirillaceae bacterium]|nr:hypothetical protein [Azospirillaceae bacterium]